MKSVVLSDHTGDMIASREKERKCQYDSAMTRYRSESASRTRRIQQTYASQMSVYRNEVESRQAKN